MSNNENVLEEGKRAIVPPFNKKDIEKIAKAACPHGIDLDKLDSYDFVKYDSSVTDIDEAIEKGVIPQSDNTYENLTDEQVKGLEKILKKAVKDGVIKYDYSYLFINYVLCYAYDITLCCGCTIPSYDSSHFTSGAHIEVCLLREDKSLHVYLHEV